MATAAARPARQACDPARQAWLEPEERYRLADPTHGLPDGADIAIGFDGSRTRDATALIGYEIATGYVFELEIWETAFSGEGTCQEIPVAEVDATVDRAFERWNPVALFGDVREWESFTNVERHDNVSGYDTKCQFRPGLDARDQTPWRG